MIGKKEYAQTNELLNARLEEKKVLIAVHRGAWGGNVIENTIPSFELALGMGADMFECDLSKSADGELFCFHDGYEQRLLNQKENIKTMSSEQIDSLVFQNSIGDASGKHVERFEEVLAHFTQGELFNVDRAWPILAETDEAMRKYPHVLKQAIIKTPVKEEYLSFFQNCPVKYMYMPIVYNMDELRKVLSYDQINVVGVEAIAGSADSEMFEEENLKWIREQGLYVWVNSITLSDHHVLSGTFDDDKALREGGDAAWGVLMERGYNVIQTDWPSQLANYRNRKLGV
ncbi:glycerophosphodiester phosphodiesterase family protein [Faecalibacterium sp. An122]|uniref:glycerophosphodiester phosphodiesterase family protein n=1 Tax=Faecalibacterium sp. An122 TaxID=1965551 RepID=UPI000B38FDF8|nr:glycerophosphodiester phosphodiesterase family protein [Faecalibacterium sp. An122]OUQ35304.1 hypothetical protein B5E67_12070 [Faecalibacterium sp. An122]